MEEIISILVLCAVFAGGYVTGHFEAKCEQGSEKHDREM